MESRAENVVKNIGAVAEATSIFYNAIVKQVPKDVALILTQHFMDVSIARRNMPPAQIAQAAAAAEARRRELEKRRQAQEEQEKAEDPPREETT
ncbi:MAG: hypothetical protein IJ206_12855 [Oscillospiraceae bacterium]|nr:hypothetical protein [Oscillospiraceae bacterium]